MIKLHLLYKIYMSTKLSPLVLQLQLLLVKIWAAILKKNGHCSIGNDSGNDLDQRNYAFSNLIIGILYSSKVPTQQAYTNLWSQCRLNELIHSIYWKILILILGMSGYVILFVLRFYGPVNPMGSCRAWSVDLITRLLGRLSPLSG